MKNLLLLAALAVATTEAATAAPTQTTPTGTMTKKERKAARQAKAPHVYKGTVAEQNRVVTDAPGAEDADGDNTTTKSSKKMKAKSKE